ncbi:MAG: histidine kinase dimerization/phospho-acceptor domain-containing protein, partial [Chloroflexota bacterium]
MNDLLCPQCGTPLTARNRVCSNCGVDVAVAALLLELTATESQPGKAAIAQEALVPRLGDFLIQRKIVTESQLGQALDLHNQSIEDGNPQTLGQALVELGLIARPDLDRAILAQVVELQSALQVSNRQLEQRVAERTTELEAALKKIGEINQLKANFVASISHELRTPLSQIKGYAALLNENQLGKLNDDQAVAVRSSVTAIEKLERLVEDLIRFASTTRGAV